jgi:hypothetical protein
MNHETFKCQYCGQLLYFENTYCERCGHTLGFWPEKGELLTLEKRTKIPLLIFYGVSNTDSVRMLSTGYAIGL